MSVSAEAVPAPKRQRSERKFAFISEDNDEMRM
jgi:hypothetical protein